MVAGQVDRLQDFLGNLRSFLQHGLDDIGRSI
jgi:hypothetical protein